jgi:hypothetical protein
MLHLVHTGEAKKLDISVFEILVYEGQNDGSSQIMMILGALFAACFFYYCFATRFMRGDALVHYFDVLSLFFCCTSRKHI